MLAELEFFDDVPGYEGLYQISDRGRVLSLERTKKGAGDSIRSVRERILKPVLNSDGYLYAPLSKDGKTKRFRISRLVALTFLERPRVQLSDLNKFFIECLKLKYQRNSQDNPLHERQVENLLKKHNLKYEYQPNGPQNSPDFRVHYNGKPRDIECKSRKQASPVYNGGLPKAGVIYIFCSKKYDKTTVFFADDIVSPVKRSLYTKFLEDQNLLLQKFRSLDEWQNDERGFDFYCRSMYIQKGGKDRVDYFTHAKRGYCEDRVIHYNF
jgi:hypothetical protein